MPMAKRPSRNWSAIAEAWRWRGPGVFFLLGLREIFRPLVYWYVFHIFQIDLTCQPVPQAYANEKVEVKIYAGAERAEKAGAEIVAMGELEMPEVVSRFARGDLVAIAYLKDEPAGYAWMSFTTGVVELAFGVTWIIGPGESVRYDYFVLPECRGRRINSCLHSAIVARARDLGIVRTFASVSALNTQSLSLPRHQQKIAAMKLTLVHVSGLNSTFHKTVGAPFASRFLKRD